MPKIARFAAVVAFVVAGLVILAGVFTQIVILPLAVVPLMSGIGILRRRVWSAYGFALYQLAQFLLVPLVFLRTGVAGEAGLMIANAAVSLGLALLFFFAGRSMAAAGFARGWAWPGIAVSALLTVPLIFLQPFVMPTGSMEDTLLIGDRLLVQRTPKPAMQRDSMIVHLYPVDRRQTFVKRVIGVPGDRIRISKKMVYRNGSALDEPYACHKTPYEDAYRDDFPSARNVRLPAPAIEMLEQHVVNGELVVPEGKYFVLGDNRDQSLDSRYFGFVDFGDVIGKPVLIYYSEDQPGRDAQNGRPAWPHHVRWGRLFKRL